MEKLISKSKNISFVILIIYAIINFLLNVALLISSSSSNWKAWTIAYGVFNGMFLLTVITVFAVKVYLKEFNKKDIFLYLMLSSIIFSGVMAGVCIGYLNNKHNLLKLDNIPISLSLVYWLSLVGNGLSLLFCILFSLKEFNVFKSKLLSTQNKELNEASFGSLE